MHPYNLDLNTNNKKKSFRATWNITELNQTIHMEGDDPGELKA